MTIRVSQVIVFGTIGYWQADKFLHQKKDDEQELLKYGTWNHKKMQGSHWRLPIEIKKRASRFLFTQKGHIYTQYTDSSW